LKLITKDHKVNQEQVSQPL